jgi:hypothetical protein
MIVLRIFRTREFSKFARRESIEDERLHEAAERATRGSIDADLGGGLIKQRVARPGQGKRGGYRTLVAFRSKDRIVFVYGFAKSERDNIGPDELQFWRRVADAFSKASDGQLSALIDASELTEIRP